MRTKLRKIRKSPGARLLALLFLLSLLYGAWIFGVALTFMVVFDYLACSE